MSRAYIEPLTPDWKQPSYNDLLDYVVKLEQRQTEVTRERQKQMIERGLFSGLAQETCFSVGQSGRCGIDCPVFKQGECKEPESFSPHELEGAFDEYDIKRIGKAYSQIFNIGMVVNFEPKGGDE